MSLNVKSIAASASVEINTPLAAFSQFNQLNTKNSTRFGKIQRLIISGSNLPR